MDSNKAGVFFITAVLATEVIKKHEEGSPHTHVEFEQAVYNSRMIPSIYGIQNNQFNSDKTVDSFPTMEFPFFPK